MASDTEEELSLDEVTVYNRKLNTEREYKKVQKKKERAEENAKILQDISQYYKENITPLVIDAFKEQGVSNEEREIESKIQELREKITQLEKEKRETRKRKTEEFREKIADRLFHHIFKSDDNEDVKPDVILNLMNKKRLKEPDVRRFHDNQFQALHLD